MVGEVLRRMRRRISMMVARGVIKLVNDGEGVQLVQVSLLKGEVKSDMERFQNYGFTGNPPVGTEGVCVFMDGDRSRGWLIGCDHRASRLKGLLAGESAMYNDKGDKVHLKSDQTLEILLHKLKIQNQNNEMIAVISAFMEKVIAAKTITAIGPQPFIPADVQAMQAEKDKFDTFKV